MRRTLAYRLIRARVLRGLTRGLNSYSEEGRELNGLPEERAKTLAQYIIENNATVRKAAAWSGISKSSVHKDVTERLKKLDPGLYRQVKAVLELNKSERHIRGGLATKAKYAAAK